MAMLSSISHKIAKGIRNPEMVREYVTSRAPSLISGFEAAAFSRYPIGDNVFDDDWDLLILLDTCRLDGLLEMRNRNRYSWLGDASLQSRLSVGGSTLEWTAQTFRAPYSAQINRTDYIAGNLLVEQVLDGKKLPEDVDNASWSPTKWDFLPKKALHEFVSVGSLRDARTPSGGHVDRPHPSAELVTDLAIQQGRTENPEKMIVHYIQPHYPYYSAVESGEQAELEDWQRFPFNQLRDGTLSRRNLWNRYLEELQLGIDAIDTLLSNYEAEKVAITADHGEAFGERFLGKKGYKHRVGMLHPKVRRVPWLVTSAKDTESHHPDIEVESNDKSQQEMLEALGYL
ncbi:hypothetical protein [Halococcus salsus]|uniref:hypothetical protein n=1 Tax=Halococcus salsus TaxID=2162894 RepID=UPI001358EC59|nr:hypothetical protein [Halococcus salsus]